MLGFGSIVFGPRGAHERDGNHTRESLWKMSKPDRVAQAVSLVNNGSYKTVEEAMKAIIAAEKIERGEGIA